MSDDEERSDPRDLFEHTEPMDEDGQPVADGEPDGDAADAEPGQAHGEPDSADAERESAPTDADSPDEQPSALPGDADRSGPLGDVATRLEERQREREEEPYDDLFEDVDVGSVDSEALWEQIDAEGPISEAPETDPEVGERVVKKSTYCQRCEYFEAPPDVGCTHEGTDILEVVDMDHFRVRNCPVVEENERLERVGVGEEGD